MTAGKHILDSQTTWLLGDRPIDTVDNLEVLGVVLDNVGSCLPHTNKRIQKSRQSYFGLVPLGLNYPGIQSYVKAYIWNLVCRPTLLYGLESIHLDPASIRQLESLQGSLVKRMNGISKRSHHNNLLLALGIPRVVEGVTDRVLSLYYQIFNVDFPMRNLCTYMLGQYTLSGQYVKNTIVGRLINMGVSPLHVAINKASYPHTQVTEDGYVDSLRFLLTHENFVKPWATEYMLTKLIVKSF